MIAQDGRVFHAGVPVMAVAKAASDAGRCVRASVSATSAGASAHTASWNDAGSTNVSVACSPRSLV